MRVLNVKRCKCYNFVLNCNNFAKIKIDDPPIGLGPSASWLFNQVKSEYFFISRSTSKHVFNVSSCSSGVRQFRIIKPALRIGFIASLVISPL